MSWRRSIIQLSSVLMSSTLHPRMYSWTIARRVTSEGSGSAGTMTSFGEMPAAVRFFEIVCIISASRLKSNSNGICRSNSSTIESMSKKAIAPACKNRASRLRFRKSSLHSPSWSAYCDLSTTAVPSLSRATCTCAMVALASGTTSNSPNTCITEFTPNSSRTVATISFTSTAGTRSCSRLSSRHHARGTKSARLPINCPSFK
mmetsp:Transcript_15139/g.38773  ORF Transcript_15139/g.38773 Transcript_15139/m.38773 type:complete len:203 (-) Transcript_15139:198-806(-)